MHSHDRTLITRLGFSDPDKKDRKHDLACRYLSQPENAEKIVRMTFSASETVNEQSERGWQRRSTSEAAYGDSERRGTRHFRALLRPPRFEDPLSKGEGQYKTTIGFIDLCLPFILERREECEERKYEREWSTWKKCDGSWHRHDSRQVCVEVKIAEVGVGEILRQINLYREYRSCHWLVATAFPLTESECEQLHVATVKHIRLGERFKHWAETQAQEAGSDSMEI